MSINGNKFNTPQWDRNDEIRGCVAPDKAPDKKVTARDQTFCGNVTILGDVVIEGNLTVSGTITAPFFNGTAARANTCANC